MNNLRKSILMDITYLMKYKEFLLNKKTRPSSNARASFCTLCNDDCVCMNSKHKLLTANLKKMECSKYCTENIFIDCICL